MTRKKTDASQPSRSIATARGLLACIIGAGLRHGDSVDRIVTDVVNAGLLVTDDNLPESWSDAVRRSVINRMHSPRR